MDLEPGPASLQGLVPHLDARSLGPYLRAHLDIFVSFLRTPPAFSIVKTVLPGIWGGVCLCVCLC